jgi:hypothetical protein
MNDAHLCLAFPAAAHVPDRLLNPPPYLGNQEEMIKSAPLAGFCGKYERYAGVAESVIKPDPSFNR